MEEIRGRVPREASAFGIELTSPGYSMAVKGVVGIFRYGALLVSISIEARFESVQ